MIFTRIRCVDCFNGNSFSSGCCTIGRMTGRRRGDELANAVVMFSAGLANGSFLRRGNHPKEFRLP